MGIFLDVPQKIITQVDVLADPAVTMPTEFLNKETLNPHPSGYI